MLTFLIMVSYNPYQVDLQIEAKFLSVSGQFLRMFISENKLIANLQLSCRLHMYFKKFDHFDQAEKSALDTLLKYINLLYPFFP